MHYVLTEAVKRRFIGELRDYWAKDPKYKDSLVPNIQGKYSFEERPQQAIILKNTSATPFRFSADNYQGVVESYCHLTKAYGKQGTSIEWVKEDSLAIQKNAGVFPTAAGIYYIEIRKEVFAYRGVPGEYLMFYVDPLLAVYDEKPLQLDPLIHQVSADRFHPGSLVVYEMPSSSLLYEGVNYSSDAATGKIILTRPLPPGTSLSTDYYYSGTSLGPFPVQENGANNEAIPGVVLAFGRRAFDGDIMAVVVSRAREGSVREYGGRFEMSLDIDLMARDVHAQAEIADRTLMFLQGELRDRLSWNGIEIEQVSFGGESEEMYDENGDDYFYTGSLSLQLFTDWSVCKPLAGSLRRIVPGSLRADQLLSAMSDEQISENGAVGGFAYSESLGLTLVQDPWFRNRDKNYEIIR